MSFYVSKNKSDSEWAVSPAMTTFRLIGVMSLARSILSMKGLEKEGVSLLNFYGLEMSKQIPHYKHPTFALLAKYWQDPISKLI
jgi:hypothetical protein